MKLIGEENPDNPDQNDLYIKADQGVKGRNTVLHICRAVFFLCTSSARFFYKKYGVALGCDSYRVKAESGILRGDGISCKQHRISQPAIENCVLLQKSIVYTDVQLPRAKQKT